MKKFRKALIPIALFFLSGAILLACNVIWKSPSFYDVKEIRKLKTPIMDMEDYDTIIGSHERPYIYSVKSDNGGSVYILGVEHVKDNQHPQFKTIETYWTKVKPTVALIEGRLGFLFTWFQNPIENYGEGGLVSKLAKESGAKLYTWEPTRDNEIEILLEQFPAEQIAMFYSFRPYFSNMRHGKPENPEKKLQQYLESRTDYEHIRGIFQSWEELNNAWRNDFPEIDWKDYSDQQGWPVGYLSEIANASNLSRDFHLIQAIVELVEKGETVFVTMGVSHAPRIEDALKAMIK